MCRPTRCRRCGNTTWAGCGSHVDQVMAGVPAHKQCTCGQSGDDDQTSNQRSRSLMDRILGR